MTVRLISGGPLMTTDEVYPNGTVQCCWFVDGHLHRDSFFPEQLMHAMIEQKA